MHIAVDAHTIKAAHTEEEHFMLALLYQLIQTRPGHDFTIICLQAGLLPVLPNVTESVIATALNSYFQSRRWYSNLLPELMRQAGVDVFISLNSAGKAFIPCIVFISSPNAVKRTFTNKFLSLLYRKYGNRHIAKADAIVTFTHLQQSVIAKHFGVRENRIIPVGYAVPPVFRPVNWQQKETILEEYTHGNEYFFYAGSYTETTFILVLKAFSLFKKRQLSSMQLIVAGSFAPGREITEKLATYKYRTDVKLYENATMEAMASLISGTYAVIYLNEKDVTAFPAVAALQCGVPVIGLENAAAFKEVAGAAGLYVSPTPESLAEQMKLLYKDENLRKQLIENAAVQMPLVNGVSAAQKLWDCIDTTAVKFRLHLPPKNEPEI